MIFFHDFGVFSFTRSRRITFGVVVLLQASLKGSTFPIGRGILSIAHSANRSVPVQGMLFATLSQWIGMLVKLLVTGRYDTVRMKQDSFSEVCFGVVLLVCLRRAASAPMLKCSSAPQRSS